MTERVVVITGATGALGKAAAKAFAEHGDSLVLLSWDQPQLDTMITELGLPEERVLARAVDLTDAGAVHSVARAVEATFGGAHILLHLVGGWTGGKTIAETDPQDFNTMLDQHARSTFNLFQAFEPQLIKSGWSRALMVSAPSASRQVAKRGAYAAAKAAQEALFLTLAEELKDQGGTANVIVVRSIDVEKKGTGTTPEEIVAAMLYLCSEEAGKINGARLPLY